MLIFKKKIIDDLSKRLNLPYVSDIQDWDLEMANSNNIYFYIKFYNDNVLDKEEKIALMSLIFASYEDYLNENNLFFDDKWEDIKEILLKDVEIFSDLFNKWLGNSTLRDEDNFIIAPLIKKIIK